MGEMVDLNFYKNKKVFVTGHTGFKGSWLCHILKLAGAEVMGYSLSHLVHIHSHGENHITINGQGEFHGVDSIKEAFLVLLQILIIGQGQALGSGQHSH